MSNLKSTKTKEELIELRKNNINNVFLFHEIEKRKVDYIFNTTKYSKTFITFKDFLINSTKTTINFKGDKRSVPSKNINDTTTTYDLLIIDLINEIEVVLDIFNTTDREIAKKNFLATENGLFLQNIVLNGNIFHNTNIKNDILIQSEIADELLISNIDYVNNFAYKNYGLFNSLNQKANITFTTYDFIANLAEEINQTIYKYDLNSTVAFTTFLHQRLIYKKQDLYEKISSSNQKENAGTNMGTTEHKFLLSFKLFTELDKNDTKKIMDIANMFELNTTFKTSENNITSSADLIFSLNNIIKNLATSYNEVGYRDTFLNFLHKSFEDETKKIEEKDSSKKIIVFKTILYIINGKMNNATVISNNEEDFTVLPVYHTEEDKEEELYKLILEDEDLSLSAKASLIDKLKNDYLITITDRNKNTIKKILAKLDK